jgi:viroplasmin and RNaseH domain-containing protein
MLIKENTYFCRSDCQMQVSNFSGAKYKIFSTETEAINFVNGHGKSNLQSKTQDICAKKMGENNSLQQPISPRMTNKNVTQRSPDTSKVIHVSSPKLKGSALKQRLSVLEKKYEDSMKELHIEIDTVKERIETFCTKVNIPSNSEASDQTEVTKEFKGLQECLSQIAKHYADSVIELRAEINSLKLEVTALGIEEGQNKANPEKGTCGGSSFLSFKRNLTSILEAVEPSIITERYVK